MVDLAAACWGYFEVFLFPLVPLPVLLIVGFWDGILRDLSQLNWPHYYHQDDPTEPLSNIIVEILDRRILSRVVTFHNKDKAWFDNDCKRAYLEKQEAYNLWKRNRSDLTWNSYVQLRSAAQEVYAFAEREFNHGIKETLLGATQPHKWWSTLKTALFGVDDGMPPLLKLDGSLTHCPKEKATLFANVFDGKQSDEVLTLPQ